MKLQEIIMWVNEKLATGGKQTRLKGFQDQSISNARILLDLIDAIKPGTINYELVKEDKGSEVGGMNWGNNNKYFILLPLFAE